MHTPTNLHACCINKSTGSDGYSMLFYQVCWEMVKCDLMKMFAEFFERGVIGKDMNATFIVFIPKKEVSRDFSDFRPIKLIKSLYKIISKVLSNKMRNVIDSVVFFFPMGFC